MNMQVSEFPGRDKPTLSLYYIGPGYSEGLGDEPQRRKEREVRKGFKDSIYYINSAYSALFASLRFNRKWVLANRYTGCGRRAYALVTYGQADDLAGLPS